MIQRISFAVFLFLLASPASAEVHWDFAGWEGGGCYPNVEFDPNIPDRVYLTSDVAGLWRSDDGGRSWRFATKGLSNLNVSLLAVAPSDSNILYAGTEAGIFVSRDAAATWNAAGAADAPARFRRPDSYRSIAVSKTRAGSLVVGDGEGGVYRSDNFGANWSCLGNAEKKNSPVTALVWLEEKDILLSATSEGLAVYSFSNPGWRPLANSPKPVSDFLVIGPRLLAAGSDKLWFSEDEGVSWKTSGAPEKGIFYRLLSLDEDGRTILAARNDGWTGIVLKSEDAGLSWRKFEGALQPDMKANPTRVWAGLHGRIGALKKDPFKPDVLIRTDWWGVWRSDNGGVDWKESIRGAPNTVVSDLSVSESGELYVATMDNGLLKSEDDGRTYKPLFPWKGYSDEINGHVWRVLAVGGSVFATSSPWGVDLNQVIFSGNGGATFTRTHSGLPEAKPKTGTVWESGYARAIAIHPSHPRRIYLGIDGDGAGFYVSDNSGHSWRRPERQPASLKIYNALAVDPADPGRLVWGSAAEGGGIHLSEDGGESWNLAYTPKGKIFDAAFGKGLMYAAGTDENEEPVLYASNDSGKNWKILKKFEGSGSVEALCVLPGGRVACGVVRWNNEAPGKIFLGSADGTEWVDITGDLPEGEGPAAITYNEKTGTLYMGRMAGSVYKTVLE